MGIGQIPLSEGYVTNFFLTFLTCAVHMVRCSSHTLGNGYRTHENAHAVEVLSRAL